MVHIYDIPFELTCIILCILSFICYNIDVDLDVSEGVETVSVVVGQHLLLPCETGAMNPPEQSTWMKDGVEVTGNKVSINDTCIQSLVVNNCILVDVH